MHVPEEVCCFSVGNECVKNSSALQTSGWRFIILEVAYGCISAERLMPQFYRLRLEEIEHQVVGFLLNMHVHMI